jgi:hypothetical protein
MLTIILADYFIYVFLMLILAFRTYRSIHVLHSKTVINKLQFWVYILTLLVASLLSAIGQGVYTFQIIATLAFLVMVILEAKELGKIEEFLKSRSSQEENQVMDGRKRGSSREKKAVAPALSNARMDFFLTSVALALSLLNVLGILNTILMRI